MSQATVTSKGQVTIPRDVRAALGLVAGDRIDFVRMQDGNFAVLPAASSVKRLKGIFPKPEKPLSLEDMERSIEAAVAGK
jgi:antitoxin PrlF